MGNNGSPSIQTKRIRDAPECPMHTEGAEIDPFDWGPEGKLTAEQQRERRQLAAYDPAECVRLAALRAESMASLPARVATERNRLRAERGLRQD